MKRTAVLTACLATVLAGGAATVATSAPSFVHTWNMQSGPAFDDFHANYLYTGGSITSLTLTIDEHGGGMISAQPSSSQIDIIWPSLVGPSEVFSYEFSTGTGQAEFISATLTKSNGSGGSDIVGLVDPSYRIFDPATGNEIGRFTTVWVPAPGAMVLLASLAVTGSRRRSERSVSRADS